MTDDVTYEYEDSDPAVSFEDQISSNHTGPVVLIGTYVVAAENMDAFIKIWTGLADIMRGQPGFLGAQFHRAIDPASALVNYAVWESLVAFRAAFDNAGFWEAHQKMPGFVGRRVLMEKIAIPGLCVA
jgi:heme-degrading monooxygenase HmoA